MSRSIVVLIASLALSAILTGCFDTRGGGRRPTSDSGPGGGDDAGIRLLDSGSVARCGDATCSPSESCSSCPADCGSCSGSCGDGTCSSPESCSSCPTDCGSCPASCGDGTCSSPETCSSCPSDCGSCPTSCRSFPVPPYTGAAPCSSATRTCAEGCADGTCIASCLESDPSPDCVGCANQNLISCFIAAGCSEEWNCLNTCYEDEGCTTATCPACGAEDAAWDTCVTTVSGCGTEWVRCLP